MKTLLGLLLGLALLPLSARSAEDPFAGWSEAQLKVKVLQLQKENSDLKAKLSAGAAVAAPAAKAAGELLLDDFEGAEPKHAKGWWAGCDDNKLGTTLSPQPWAPSAGGSKLSPGHSGRISGSFGKAQEPWPWASLALALNEQDLRGYSALRFSVKGDGRAYVARLCKATVKDFAYHAANFTATKDWSTVTLKFSDFAQPNWGAPVAAEFSDVEKFEFSPSVNEQPYDLAIDDVTLVP